MCDKIQTTDIVILTDEYCGDCLHFDGEECNGDEEGSVKYDDTIACGGFDEKEGG